MKKIQLPTTFLFPLSLRNASFGRYKLTHYKSFSESQQKTLFVKTIYIKMKFSNAKFNKRDIKNDILGFPKSHRLSSNDENLESYGLHKLGNFQEIHEILIGQICDFKLLDLIFSTQTCSRNI